MEQFGFYFNAKRCTGCKTCMLACKDYRNLDASVSFRQVYEFVGGSWSKDERGCWAQDCFAFYVSSACNHCASPACMEVCPTGAMGKNELGLVSVDEHRCIGCGYCTMACPYHAPHIDARLKRSSKCDGCRDRLVDGEQPVCVEACPLRALEFGLTSELTDRHPDAVRSILPLPDESATRPNLLILPSPAAERAEKQGGSIVNRTELHL